MKLLVCALEASANLHLKEVIKYLDGVQLFGIFDSSLGQKPLYESSEFGIMGVVDAIKIYKKAKKALKNVSRLALKCDAVLLIDSPAFNLPMAKELKKIGFKKKITYYILPQVWAWKKGRVKEVEKYCDNLLAILPFEQRFWNRAEFVGNPIVDEIVDVKTSWEDTGKIAFLPGSRISEIKALMPIYKELAKKFNTKKTLAVPIMYKNKNLNEIYGDIKEFEVVYDTHKALLDSSFAFVCSGTATLEATIIGTPFVLVYKAKKIDYIIGRALVRLPYVGLANLMYYFDKKEPIHPEFLQNDVTVKNLFNSYKEYNKKKFIDNSVQLRKILKVKFGASKRVAQILKG